MHTDSSRPSFADAAVCPPSLGSAYICYVRLSCSGIALHAVPSLCCRAL